MPIFYLRRLTGRERTQNANQQLARYLTFVAGAINAGGFLAVRQYSSHVTGIVSAMADNLALRTYPWCSLAWRPCFDDLRRCPSRAWEWSWTRAFI